MIISSSFRESANPFVEQAVQFSVAAAHAVCVDKDKKDMLHKLLLQGTHCDFVADN